ncbi:DUF1800 domain-containing protein [Paracrocinitomix mangrovi]|uniref:DUF1800 domain-containing protein n=1 Tax=Paracrocinitomix mangrovi TaxID=2862509 RepID=UPI001C8DFA8F|nr:DUF1800 domain-containing protein [Paracrocinitomix mangrovi]UKN03372.1 DUF1800 domain-containing protein [Paracrocinitomix mangrovi]
MKPTISHLYHLHARAEFFAHHNDIKLTYSIEQAVDQIFKNQKVEDIDYNLPRWDPEQNKKQSDKKKKEMRKTWRGHVRAINHLWLKQMMENDKGLVEKMTLFWHGHFACRTVDNPYLTLELNSILRKNALGSFRDLLYGVSKSAAMIGYLHLRQNKKDQPNEDFARELCELFTLGRDVDYTEKDVTEIARAFSGWTTDLKGNWLVRPRIHDEGEKTIFGKTGNYGGEDVLEMILENKNTAKHIAAKVYRFFVQELVNEDHLNELADVFYKSNYDITAMMKHLFKSEWFYQSKGKIIKSPIEFMVSMGKMFELKYPEQKTTEALQRYLGHVLFDPPNVAGWPGGRQWIDASRLALRLRLGSLIINKGYVMDELSPELDEMITSKQKKKDIKFFEEVDWNKFFDKNKDANIFDLLVRSDNPDLHSKYKVHEMKTVLHLVSTPDFQLT